MLSPISSLRRPAAHEGPQLRHLCLSVRPTVAAEERSEGQVGGLGEGAGSWLEAQEPTSREEGEGEGDAWGSDDESWGCSNDKTSDVFDDVEDIVAALRLQEQANAPDGRLWAECSASALPGASGARGRVEIGQSFKISGEARVVSGRVCKAAVWLEGDPQAGAAPLPASTQSDAATESSLLFTGLQGCLEALLCALSVAQLTAGDVAVRQKAAGHPNHNPCIRRTK